MEWSPSREANSASASQKFPLILWNPKVYDSLHKSLPLVAILSQLNLVHTLSYSFLNIHIAKTWLILLLRMESDLRVCRGLLIYWISG